MALELTHVDSIVMLLSASEKRWCIVDHSTSMLAAADLLILDLI